MTGTLSGAGTLDGTRIGGPLYDGTAVTFAAFRNRRQCTGSRATALEPVPAPAAKGCGPTLALTPRTGQRSGSVPAGAYFALASLLTWSIRGFAVGFVTVCFRMMSVGLTSFFL